MYAYNETKRTAQDKYCLPHSAAFGVESKGATNNNKEDKSTTALWSPHFTLPVRFKLLAQLVVYLRMSATSGTKNGSDTVRMRD